MLQGPPNSSNTYELVDRVGRCVGGKTGGKTVWGEAQAVDRLYQEVAGHLETINGLLISYQMEGGSFARSLKDCSTRAALAAGLRQYLETGFVGGNEHVRPLAEQLTGLVVARVPEDWLVETPPAA